ncbi:MAG TPA: 1-acyl-sn-glycerol-3-phosphate acyltransferase [Candidatus Solibacter sp.]|jgi:1-acyl-sn-glycerol-3-phosphate acyltransferase|nr:1-acyl-sn-glycerol-3-phosphate acyltransferase [Candidatus Solibacter sp.]
MQTKGSSATDEPAAPPPADLLPVQRKATLAYRLIRVLLLPVFHVLFIFQVKGRRNTPKGGAYVLIANHLNWLDSFALTASFPPEPRMHFLGDPTILQTRKVQWAFVRMVGGYIPVNNRDGSGPTLYHHVDRCLEQGGVVALYPEGHYGAEEGKIDEFKKGFAHFAIHNHVPVLPVALSGTQDLWLRKKILVFIGEPIEPEGHTVESLVAEGHARMEHLLPAYRAPWGPRLLRNWLTHLL